MPLIVGGLLKLDRLLKEGRLVESESFVDLRLLFDVAWIEEVGGLVVVAELTKVGRPVDLIFQMSSRKLNLFSIGYNTTFIA